MQNKLMFISFYSKDTIYEQLAKERLLPSLKKFNLDYKFYEIKNRGSWHQNTCQKPKIILEAMYEFKDKNIVWIDADAEIKKYPSLLYIISNDYNMGVHYLSWEDHYGRTSDKGRFELVDGTIYIYNNEKMREFIEKWKQNSTDKETNHQKILARMLEERKDIKVYDFGREYCYINTTPSGKKPAKIIESPTIVHYQASRNGKRNLYEK